MLRLSCHILSRSNIVATVRATPRRTLHNPHATTPVQQLSATNIITARTMSSSTSTAGPGNVHPLASSAFSTSGESGLYDRARPSYPPEALSHIFTALHCSSSTKSNTNDTGINIIELGAGTGIFSRLLLSPPQDIPKPPSISKFLAVEPAVGMRQGFTTSLQKLNIPVGSTGVTGTEVVQVVNGSFTDIPVPEAWADAIIIAQAFHWSHPNYESTLSSFARVLRPHAPLILLWNLEDRSLPEIHPWVPKIRDAYEAHEVGTPQYRHMWWKKIFELPEFEQFFDKEYQFEEVKRVLPTTVDGVVERVLSKSYITALSANDKQAVEEKVRDVVENEKKVWIDEGKGVFEYPYATDLYVIRRKA
ncbi:hypothetical protein TWF694_004584 [Orbilia ellipsospora]|uniref:Methyltransferase type 11 domain-containing protein n=1 Tax=Orbilia ellipsospora TaxID=2528407 RepID=A0AAV9WVK4_9PEZI